MRPKFTYLGHATVRCDLPGGEVVLIDPWVGGNPACPDELKTLDRLDAMLITHAHFDHIADAVSLAQQYKPIKVVVGCFEICHWLESKGVENTSAMNLGGSQGCPGDEGHDGACRSLVRHQRTVIRSSMAARRVVMW